MDESNHQGTGFLSLPGEIRNRIYRLIIVHQEPVKVFAWPQTGNDAINFSPRIPALAVACHTTYKEIRTIFYQENTFRLTECSLRNKRLDTFRQRAGESAAKLKAIKITRNYRVDGMLAYMFSFTARATDTGTTVSDVSYRHLGTRIDNCDDFVISSVCLCKIQKLGESSTKPPLDFLEDYLEIGGRQPGGKQRVVYCMSCNKYGIVCDEYIQKHLGEISKDRCGRPEVWG